MWKYVLRCLCKVMIYGCAKYWRVVTGLSLAHHRAIRMDARLVKQAFQKGQHASSIGANGGDAWMPASVDMVVWLPQCSERTTFPVAFKFVFSDLQTLLLLSSTLRGTVHGFAF